MFNTFLVLNLLVANGAEAGPFYPKTMTQELPQRHIDRNLVLPKGVMGLGLNLSSKYSTGYRDEQGVFQAYQNTSWSYTQYTVQYNSGLSKRLMLNLEIPWVMARLKTENDGLVQTFALGDVQTSVRYQPKIDGTNDVAFELKLKSPSGVEWPESNRGSPADIQSFLTGTGTTNLETNIYLQVPFKNYASTLSGGYVLTFRSIVGYVVEDAGFGNGILDPGNVLWATWTNLFQFSNTFSASFYTTYKRHGTYRIGVSGAGTGWENPKTLQDPTAFLDGGFLLHFEPESKYFFSAGAEYQMLGSDTRTFAALGLEAFSPQPGITAKLNGGLRW